MNFYTGSGTLITVENAVSGIVKKAPWATVIHRGWVSGAKENTLPAMWLVKENGYDWAECDIRITSDGVPVLAHNMTVVSEDGATELSVADSTLEQLQSVVLQTHARFGQIRVPTLKEVLDMARLIGLNLVLDLKNATALWKEEANKTVAKTVLESGWAHRVVYMPLTAAMAAVIGSVDRNASFDFVCSYTSVEDLPDLAPYTALLTGGNTVGFDLGGGTDPQMLQTIREAGLSVSYWNVSSANCKAVMDAGPLRITKNNNYDKTDLDALYFADKIYW